MTGRNILKKASKQTTLFGSWGTSKPVSSISKLNDDWDDIPDDLLTDDLIENIVATEVQDTKGDCPAKQVGHNNSSLYEDIPGFDCQAGQSYIYPINYPIRDYQYNIVKKCLYRNTLVSLPTGLGKTFIAAVIMYNFYRWYPGRKVIFLAPTKPLVSQQVEACFKIMGIPQENTVEMTGSISPKERVNLWLTKRVFYLTPQVLHNDLDQGICNPGDICCLVFDEAHKALGNHSYCQVVKKLASAEVVYRIVALSATPGSDLKAVQQVIDNLQIAHIELRSEDSLDIQPYIHQRSIEKIVVPLEGEISQVRMTFKKIIGGVLSRLANQNLIYHTDVDRLSKFQILQARENFRKTSVPSPQSGAVESIFALSISLCHAYELLLQHGMRSFYNFLQQSITDSVSKAKLELTSNREFKQIMSSLRDRVNETADSALQLNSSMYCPSVKMTGNFFYSHPKLEKLENVILSHFNSHSGSPTKAMIFSQYRESVYEIADMLSQHTPLVKVMSFIGHSTNSGKKCSKGQTQKEQIEVVQKFRVGGYNTLVSTCVGEEGLDIGEVDLIICFDAHKSPIRLVQRMGRTGRKRQGKIVIIVSQGKEEQTYLKSISNKTSIHQAIRDGSKSLKLYPFSSRMIPSHLMPKVEKVHIEVGEFTTKDKPRKINKPQKRNCLGLSIKNDPKGVFLTSEELSYWHNNFALPETQANTIAASMNKCMSHDGLLIKGDTVSYDNILNSWTHLLLTPISTSIIGHSLLHDALHHVLSFSDNLQMNPENEQNFNLEMDSNFNKENVVKTIKESSLKKTKTSNHILAKSNKSKSKFVSADTSIVKDTPQKTVPCPPNDSLDWLDDFMPTPKPQVKNNNLLGNSLLHCSKEAPPHHSNSLAYNDHLHNVTLPSSPFCQSLDQSACNSSHHSTLPPGQSACNSPPYNSNFPHDSNSFSHHSNSSSHHSISSSHHSNSSSHHSNSSSHHSNSSSHHSGSSAHHSKSPFNSSHHHSPKSPPHHSNSTPLHSPPHNSTPHHSIATLPHNIIATPHNSTPHPSTPHPSTPYFSTPYHSIHHHSNSTPYHTSHTPLQSHQLIKSTPYNHSSLNTPLSRSTHNFHKHDEGMSLRIISPPIQSSHNKHNSHQFSTPLNTKLPRFASPDSEEKFLKKARGKRLRLRQPNFLLSQFPNNSCSSDIKTKVTKSDVFNEYIEQEAEDDSSMMEGEEEEKEEEYDEYDYSDDFINDKSVLTQYVSPHGKQSSPVNMKCVYRQSLISPDNIFGRNGNNNCYKLVLSQRFKILNDCLNKAAKKKKKGDISDDLSTIDEDNVLNEDMTDSDSTRGNLLDNDSKENELFESNSTKGDLLEDAPKDNLMEDDELVDKLLNDDWFSDDDAVYNDGCIKDEEMHYNNDSQDNSTLIFKISQLVNNDVIVSPSLMVSCDAIDENDENFLTEEEFELFMKHDESFELF